MGWIKRLFPERRSKQPLSDIFYFVDRDPFEDPFFYDPNEGSVVGPPESNSPFVEMEEGYLIRATSVLKAPTTILKELFRSLRKLPDTKMIEYTTFLLQIGKKTILPVPLLCKGDHQSVTDGRYFILIRSKFPNSIRTFTLFVIHNHPVPPEETPATNIYPSFIDIKLWLKFLENFTKNSSVQINLRGVIFTEIGIEIYEFPKITPHDHNRIIGALKALEQLERGSPAFQRVLQTLESNPYNPAARGQTWRNTFSLLRNVLRIQIQRKVLLTEEI